jgi:hypothetical protein
MYRIAHPQLPNMFRTCTGALTPERRGGERKVKEWRKPRMCNSVSNKIPGLTPKKTPRLRLTALRRLRRYVRHGTS